MKLDFLLFYEHASRELETGCYLASLLKQRGYRVKVINRRYLWRIFLNPKVIITPYLYGDDDVHEFTGFISGRRRAIIDLQYEQIFNDIRLASNFSKPSALSSLATHICWGEKTRDRLINNGIAPIKLPVTGAISMDFNRPQLRSILKTRSELAEEFELDVNKKWHLFISSFVYSSLSKQAIDIIEKKIPGYGAFVSVTCDSQMIVVDWIKSMSKKHPEQLFIYRPHPNEFDTPLIKELSEYSNNIKVISKYSIRQWVAISDTCSNWFSTSMADCYFANRPCCLLRPIQIPGQFEIKILEGSNHITKLDEFDAFLSSDEPKKCPMDMTYFSGYYLIDLTKMFGERVADVCEQVLHGNDFPFNRSWKDCFVSFKYDLLAWFFRHLKWLGNSKNSRFYDFHRMAENTRYDETQLKMYTIRFDSIFCNGK